MTGLTFDSRHPASYVMRRDSFYGSNATEL